jgi:hypothetical protein
VQARTDSLEDDNRTPKNKPVFSLPRPLAVVYVAHIPTVSTQIDFTFVYILTLCLGYKCEPLRLSALFLFCHLCQLMVCAFNTIREVCFHTMGSVPAPPERPPMCPSSLFFLLIIAIAFLSALLWVSTNVFWNYAIRFLGLGAAAGLGYVSLTGFVVWKRRSF